MRYCNATTAGCVTATRRLQDAFRQRDNCTMRYRNATTACCTSCHKPSWSSCSESIKPMTAATTAVILPWLRQCCRPAAVLPWLLQYCHGCCNAAMTAAVLPRLLQYCHGCCSTATTVLQCCHDCCSAAVTAAVLPWLLHCCLPIHFSRNSA